MVAPARTCPAPWAVATDVMASRANVTFFAAASLPRKVPSVSPLKLRSDQDLSTAATMRTWSFASILRSITGRPDQSLAMISGEPLASMSSSGKRFMFGSTRHEMRISSPRIWMRASFSPLALVGYPMPVSSTKLWWTASNFRAVMRSLMMRQKRASSQRNADFGVSARVRAASSGMPG